MFDFEIQRCTRVCCETGEPLLPGETFYSVLQWEENEIVRKDFRAASWSGPPEDAIGWWQGVMPTPQARGPDWAPDDVLLQYFDELGGQPDQETLRYVLALLLVRRRILRLVDSESQPDELVAMAPLTEQRYTVKVRRPAPDELETLEGHLRELLVADSAEAKASESCLDEVADSSPDDHEPKDRPHGSV